MKEEYTHIPTHTHANVLKVSRDISERSRLQKSLLMLSSSDTNSVILIMQLFSLYLLPFLLSSLCFTLFLAPESGGYMQ